jgi:hypothetical protein
MAGRLRHRHGARPRARWRLRNFPAGRRAGSSASRHGFGQLALGSTYAVATTAAGWVTLTRLVGTRQWLGAAAALSLGGSAWAKLREGRNFRRGGDGERRVGRRLQRLERTGWLVAHDVRKPAGGNVDHLLAAPSGALFTIETKLNRFDRADLAQARRHADWAQRKFRLAATPLLCVANGKGRPRIYAGVWCVGATRVAPLLVGLEHGGARDSAPRRTRRGRARGRAD